MSTSPNPISRPGLSGLDPSRLMAAALRPAPETTPGWAWEPPTLDQVVRLFPEYAVEALIGRGSMGAVYRAVQQKLGRTVAIKLLPAEVAAQGDLAGRFEREARTMASLSHANIVALHDFGRTAEGHLYIVMEHVDGTDLGQLMRAADGKKLGVPRVLEIVRQICDALQYAHSRGLVHRDIKPGNVLVSREGNVKVADFGLAKLMGSAATLTGQTSIGAMVGTPEYTAPEQLRGGDVDHRADIYSLGVMFYEMLTGDLPRGAWQPPSQRVPAADAGMDAVVTRAMQQEPDRRYQQASEIKGALSGQATTSPLPRAGQSQEQDMRDRKRSRRLAWFMWICASSILYSVPVRGFLNLTLATAPFVLLGILFYKWWRRPGIMGGMLAGVLAAQTGAVSVGWPGAQRIPPAMPTPSTIGDLSPNTLAKTQEVLDALNEVIRDSSEEVATGISLSFLKEVAERPDKWPQVRALYMDALSEGLPVDHPLAIDIEKKFNEWAKLHGNLMAKLKTAQTTASVWKALIAAQEQKVESARATMRQIQKAYRIVDPYYGSKVAADETAGRDAVVGGASSYNDAKREWEKQMSDLAQLMEMKLRGQSPPIPQK